MDLLSKNKTWLRILLGFLRVSGIEARTDSPAAKVAVRWTHRGEDHEQAFTLGEVLAELSETTREDETSPPGGYIDITDLP